MRDTIADYSSDLLSDLLARSRDKVNKGLPCVVTTVYSNSVDVELIRNDDKPNIIVTGVPIQRPETNKAYIFLGLSKGDYGTLKFMDKSIQAYKDTGTKEYDGIVRNHSLSDGVFEYGFVPNSSAFTYPTDKTIELGNKNGSFKLSIDADGNLDIKATNITVTASDVKVTSPMSTYEGNVTITGGLAIGLSLIHISEPTRPY